MALDTLYEDELQVALPTAQVARYAYAPMYDTPPTFVDDVRKSAGVEIKRSTVNVNNPVGFITHVNISFTESIIQGDRNTQRIGNTIRPLALDGHLFVRGNTNGTSGTFLRVGILQWHSPTVPSPFDPDFIMQNQLYPQGPYNLEEEGTFTILWDAIVAVENTTTARLFTNSLPVSVDISTIVAPTYETPGGPILNQIYLFAITQNTPDPGAQLYGSVSMYYSDT